MPFIVRQVKKLDETLIKHAHDLWGVDWNVLKRHVWVYFDGKEWAAYAAAVVQNDVKLYLGPTYVKPEYRGQGLQHKLIKIREKFARRNGFSELISCTDYPNLYSANNLIRCGFTLYDSEDDSACHHWRKFLK